MLGGNVFGAGHVIPDPLGGTGDFRRKPVEPGGGFAEFGFRAADDEEFVERLGGARFAIFEPGPGGGENAGGAVVVVGQEGGGVACEDGGAVAAVAILLADGGGFDTGNFLVGSCSERIFSLVAPGRLRTDGIAPAAVGAPGGAGFGEEKGFTVFAHQHSGFPETGGAHLGGLSEIVSLTGVGDVLVKNFANGLGEIVAGVLGALLAEQSFGEQVADLQACGSGGSRGPASIDVAFQLIGFQYIFGDVGGIFVELAAEEIVERGGEIFGGHGEQAVFGDDAGGEGEVVIAEEQFLLVAPRGDRFVAVGGKILQFVAEVERADGAGKECCGLGGFPLADKEAGHEPVVERGVGGGFVEPAGAGEVFALLVAEEGEAEGILWRGGIAGFEDADPAADLPIGGFFAPAATIGGQVGGVKRAQGVVLSGLLECLVASSGEETEHMLKGRRGAVIARGGLLEIELGGGGKIGNGGAIEQVGAGFFAKTGGGQPAGIDASVLGDLAGLLEKATGLGEAFNAGVFQCELAEHEGGEGALVAAGFLREGEQFFPGGLGCGIVVFRPRNGSRKVEGKFLWEREAVECRGNDFLWCGSPVDGEVGGAEVGDFGLIESGARTVAIRVGGRSEKGGAPVGKGAEGFFRCGGIGGFLIEKECAV